MSEEPHDEYWEEVLSYCDKCCEGCPPDEMCPGCECGVYCEELVDKWEDLE